MAVSPRTLYPIGFANTVNWALARRLLSANLGHDVTKHSHGRLPPFLGHQRQKQKGSEDHQMHRALHHIGPPRTQRDRANNKRQH